jgi:VWFA-related protein
LSVVTVAALGAAGQTLPPTPPPVPQTAPPTSAPAAPGQQGPVFRSSVDIVHLDVSVFDKSRRPVLGLTQADFTVLEDGKPQTVSVFSEVDVPDAEEPPAKWMKVVSPDVRSNDLRDSRLFVIVLDDALIPGDQRMQNNAKDIVHQIVDKLGPTDMAAIVLTGDNRNTQDFTNDHARLLAVLDKFSPGLASYTFGKDAPLEGGGGGGGLTAGKMPPPPNTDVYFYESAVGTLRNVADFLVAVPQRRKSLIWVSPGVPLDFETTAPALAGPGSSMADKEAMSRLVDDVQEVFRRAQRANVAVYPIDPSGLGGMEQYIFSRVTGKMPGPAAMDFAHRQATNQLEFVSTMAENTGGRATVNTNDYKEGIAQVFRENSAYYLLGFQPTNGKADGNLRRIQVKVNRPDAEVRARTGYYAPEAVKVTETAKSASASPLATALASLLPNPDMPMQVTVAPFARVALPEPAQDKNAKKDKSKDNKATSTVAITLGARQRARDDSATARVVEDVELLASAFTPEGTSRGSTRQTAHITLRQGATGEFGYEVVTKIDLPPGRYELRLATYSGTLEKTGSVFTDVVVPDFTAAPLSLSGVVVNRTPAIPSGPKDALRPLLPFQPTSNRDFGVGDKVAMFVRVYQGGKAKLAPVAINVKILDSADKAVFDKTDTLDVARFETATRAADYTVPVEPVSLKPGPYVITFTATLGKDTAKRDVMFMVR